MKPLALIICTLSAACSPWAQVKDAKTIEAARSLLGMNEPKVTAYPPNSEAWYFGKNQCVLFVDGKLVLSKTSNTEDTYETGEVKTRPDWKQKQVICAPSEVR